MSELTWRSGRPGHLEAHGECIIELYEDLAAPVKQYKIRIMRADPRILVSAELVDEIRRNDWPNATLDGNILKIKGTNRTVIYRIGEKVPDLLAFYAEWPD